jgi:uncharacterized protein
MRNVISWLVYLALGILFGIALTMSEVVSWFRIQEMFRFHSFRMFGIIGSAIAVAAVSLQLIKRLGLKSLEGSPITLQPKTMGRGIRYAGGGVIFGVGWALAGSCPGPMFALAAGGVPVMIVAIFSALLGTWVYGLVRPRLPH